MTEGINVIISDQFSDTLSRFTHENFIESFLYNSLRDPEMSKANISFSLIEFRFYPGKYILGKCVRKLFITSVERI